ncbi:MAG TPA: hypothetical protein VFH39_00485 [Candidatus Saccharimonadales bacterium]|nr:hypothetical protein [Candidatus Saccharimonadales bacterium]
MVETRRNPMHNEWDAQRRLSDAELIRGGAAFVGHLAVHAARCHEGLLAVNEYQWEKARLVRDVSFRVATELGLDLQSNEWRALFENTSLDEPLAHHWYENHPHDDARVPRILDREGIDTVRDLLVIGRQKTQAIRSFGPKTVDKLAVIVKGEAPEVEWLDEPSVQDIASFCESIYQVNAKVLVDGRESFPSRLSVRDVLVLPEADRTEVLADSKRYWPDYLREEFARDVYARAELFALRFDLAKGGAWTNPKYLATD